MKKGAFTRFYINPTRENKFAMVYSKDSKYIYFCAPFEIFFSVTLHFRYLYVRVV